MVDHLRYIYSDLPIDAKAGILKDWPELFAADGKLKKFPKLMSSMMLEKIQHFASLKGEAKDVQHIYSIFSKYEHNGAFTFDLLHNPFSEKGSEVIKSMITSGVGCCVVALRIVCDHWIEKDDPLSTRLDELKEKFFT